MGRQVRKAALFSPLSILPGLAISIPWPRWEPWRVPGLLQEPVKDPEDEEDQDEQGADHHFFL